MITAELLVSNKNFFKLNNAGGFEADDYLKMIKILASRNKEIQLPSDSEILATCPNSLTRVLEENVGIPGFVQLLDADSLLRLAEACPDPAEGTPKLIAEELIFRGEIGHYSRMIAFFSEQFVNPPSWLDALKQLIARTDEIKARRKFEQLSFDSFLQLPEVDPDFLPRMRERKKMDGSRNYPLLGELTSSVVIESNCTIGVIPLSEVIHDHPGILKSSAIPPEISDSIPGMKDWLLDNAFFPADPDKATRVVPWNKARLRESGIIDGRLFFAMLPHGYFRVFPGLGTKGVGSGVIEENERFGKEIEFGSVLVGTTRGVGSVSLHDFGVLHPDGAQNEATVMNAVNICGGRASHVLFTFEMDKEIFLSYCQKFNKSYFTAIKGGGRLREDLAVAVRLCDEWREADREFSFEEHMRYFFSVIQAEYLLNERANPGSFATEYNIDLEVNPTDFLALPFEKVDIAQIAKLYIHLATRNVAVLARLGFYPNLGHRDRGLAAFVHDAEAAFKEREDKYLPLKDALYYLARLMSLSSPLTNDEIILAINGGIQSVTSQ